ncbi:MAG: hypothetical protein OEY77_00125 [Nitrospira sp.]|nr:hypothetical protein [Nitrospira sp.]
MLPAIPLALKIGGPILMAGLVIGGWYLYKESIRDQGREEIRQEQAEEVAEQHERVKAIERAEYESTIDILKRQMAEKQDFDAKTRRVLADREAQIKKLRTDIAIAKNQPPEVIHETQIVEVEKLVPYHEPCFVSWGDVDTVDNLTRVLNEIPYHRVPDVLEAGQRGDLSGPSSVTCAAFTKRIAELTSRLGHTLINHRTMSEHAWSQYQLQETFRKGVPQDAP